MVENTTPFDFQIVKVVISAERLRFVVDIARVISEINIYEHVDKPFLTGNIVFNDNDNLYNDYQRFSKISQRFSTISQRFYSFMA